MSTLTFKFSPLEVGEDKHNYETPKSSTQKSIINENDKVEEENPTFLSNSSKFLLPKTFTRINIKTNNNNSIINNSNNNKDNKVRNINNNLDINIETTSYDMDNYIWSNDDITSSSSSTTTSTKVNNNHKNNNNNNNNKSIDKKYHSKDNKDKKDNKDNNNNNSNNNGNSKKECFHFIKQGSCKKGDKCDFSHVKVQSGSFTKSTSKTTTTTTTTTTSTAISKSNIKNEVFEDPRLWSVERVGKWLESIDLAALVEVFAEQAIDGDVLLSIGTEEYEQLGLNNIGKKKKFELNRDKLVTSMVENTNNNNSSNNNNKVNSDSAPPKKEKKAYEPFRNNHAINAYLEKRIDELDRGDDIMPTLQSPMHQASIDDILGRTGLEPQTMRLILGLFGHKTLKESFLDTASNALFMKLMKSNFMCHFSGLASFITTSHFRGSKQVQVDCIQVFLQITQKFSKGYSHIPLETFEREWKASPNSKDPNIDFWIKKIRQQNIMDKERIILSMTDDIPIRYHALSIYPSRTELRSKTLPLLKPLRVGRYESVEEYIDTQYCLLREDLIHPMREALADFEAGKYSRYLYKDVKFKSLSCTNTSISYNVQFKPDRQINWQKYSRLLKGSLVGLSCDRFNTIVWAVVESRPMEGNDPRITISILHDSNDYHDDDFDGNGNHIFDSDYMDDSDEEALFEKLSKFNAMSNSDEVLSNLFSKTFLMIESPAYFEAYKSVLKSLKDIDSETLPFKEYLLECDVDTRPPEYIRRFPTIDFSDAFEEVEPFTNIDVLKSFPSKLDALDVSQMEAVQHCLKSEISLVQGPPGTGKTFIGLKLFELLFQHINKHMGSTKHPILVICYTNHALDQFVQGCLNTTKSIIRLGSRSKEPELEKYNIRNHISRSRGQWGLIKRRDSLVDSISKIALKLRDSLNLNYDDLKMLAKFDHYESMAFRGPSSVKQWFDSIKNIIVQQNKNQTSNLTAQQQQQQQQPQQPVVEDDEEIDAETLEELMESRMQDFEVKEKLDEIDISLALWINDQVSNDYSDVDNVHSLDIGERIQLYRHWQKIKIRHCLDELNVLKVEYEKTTREILEYEDIAYMNALKHADVVAATTTGASRLKRVLESIKSRIVIIEEAAEVLESHIVSVLPKTVEHLIMIGDHKQLKPSSQVYQLSKKYNLSLSLFERIVKNGMSFKSLAIQRRMVPNISQFVKPVYPHLIDHPSVIERYTQVHTVQGMPSNVFFLDHRHMENSNETSKSNIFEADFVARLAEYIVQHNYSPNNIAILTPYTGQLLKIRSRVNRMNLKGITIRTVDQFQGEERDFIILSLVRSNNEGSTGFLSIENRINVLLSRARNAMYIVGNSQLLSKANDLWVNLISKLKEEKKLDTFIPLVCVNHPDTITQIRNAADFDNVPEGGCNKRCDARLDCAHQCPRSCHIGDSNHKNVTCTQYCHKPLDGCDHICQGHCHEGSRCGPCKTQVQVTLHCGHSTQKSCSTPTPSVICQVQCQKSRPDCGHNCNGVHVCGVSCIKDRCQVVVNRVFPCGHSHKLPCFNKSISCNIKCKKILPCGHPCKVMCKEHKFENGELVHPDCTNDCSRKLICNHICIGHKCVEQCKPCSRNCTNQCKHSKCKKPCNLPCDPCKERCLRYGPNGVRCSKLCNEICDVTISDEACQKLLNCKHPCLGLRGETCPALCRQCNPTFVEPISRMELKEFQPEERFIQLDCKHIFAVEQLDTYMNMKEDAIVLKCCPECKTTIYSNILRYKDIVNENWRNIEKIKERLRHTITKDEINQVIHANGFTAGHWFKCPKNHIYYIDACGGAMEVGKCIECKEQVGGTNHRLLDTNSHSNVDGTIMPQYPYGHEPQGF
ncbi:NF-X1-type zinc finger-containing protein [Heterostelium album PN500]|uniref:NF-X1-type zinc finger-containing protein n=1 Tax=Heterostelium pallidum (strain ATCC 26659 / Pp 5 / PN500) TaxID=670386 RepID=D3BL58_HETP5|nr:NF-X1-type zinc finger-containing protein [Heterostelium album PN500]EFA77792.1 NF-X1-type zinc finger-containing protein [Heterostelium album PN500]|eukprot:XP_020429920.1 NF-X1-type zinc finger-containing protein [Heterostelium album PN500]